MGGIEEHSVHTKRLDAATPPSRPIVSPSRSDTPGPETLTIPQIHQGVGARPDTEIFNTESEGFEARDPFGREVLVILCRPMGEESSEENHNPPVVVSVQRIDCSLAQPNPRSVVHQFSISENPCIPQTERELFGRRLEELAELLRVPETFERGMQGLTVLASGRNSCVEQSSYMTSEESFSPSAPWRRTPEFAAQLRRWLKSKEVPVENWGKGEAKGFDELVNELVEGEGVLSCEKGDVYLENRVVLLWVESPDGSERLIETRQVFSDSRVRVRGSLGGLLAEKGAIDQSPWDIAKKLMKEELHLDLDAPLAPEVTFEEEGVSHRIEGSQCFPGIWKRNTYFILRCRMPESHYRPEYSERGEKKTTFFGWVPNPSAPQ